MKAVLLCGGEGVRLRPLTCDIPKPMLPVLGKPLLEYTLRHLASHGFRDAAVTLGYLPEKIMEVFQSGSRTGVTLEYFPETKPLGTAGSVRNALHGFTGTFLVISGDALTDVDLKAAWDFHQACGARFTCVLKKVTEPSRFGVAVTDARGQIQRFQEKPDFCESVSFRANTGIYIADSSILEQIPEDEAFDFAKDLFPKLVEEGSLWGWEASGYWSDIGDVRTYLQAQEDLLTGKVCFNFPEGAYPELFVDQDARIDPSARLHPPLYVGKGCVIAEDCVVGPGSVLEEGAVLSARSGVKGSLVGTKCRLEKDVQLRSAVLAQEVVCGAGCRVFEGAVLGRGAMIGAMATVHSQVRIWPGKVISPGESLSKDVVFGHSPQEALFSGSEIQGWYGRDLSVSQLSRLGQAMGKTLTEGARFGLAHSGGKEAEAVAHLLASAISEQGGTVVSFGAETVALLRYAVCRTGLMGAVHVASLGRSLSLHPLNSHGYDLSRREMRTLQDTLERMGEACCVREPGQCLDFRGLEPFFAQEVRTLDLGGKGERISLAGKDAWEREKDEALLRNMGFQPTDTEPVLTMEVPGFGEPFRLLDEQGSVYAGEDLRRLLWKAALTLRRFHGKMPVEADTLTQELEGMAQDTGLMLYPTASSAGQWMQAMAAENRRPTPEDSGMFTDPILCVCVLCKALREKGLRLSEFARDTGEKRLSDEFRFVRSRREDVLERMRLLRAEAAEEFDTGLIFRTDGKRIVLECRGAEDTVRVHAPPDEEERMRVILDAMRLT